MKLRLVKGPMDSPFVLPVRMPGARGLPLRVVVAAMDGLETGFEDFVAWMEDVMDKLRLDLNAQVGNGPGAACN